jgi:crossover junction endodeoxyribonuclease RuvC
VNSPVHDSRPICVLGLDPAVAGATGYGVVESDGRNCRMLRFGAWRPGTDQNNPTNGSGTEHLNAIYSLVTDLIREFSPHSVAIESVFASLNIKTALRLAEVRGVVLLAAAQAGIKSFSYSPREIKLSVAGYGHADKDQVQKMVRALLGMSETPEPPDAADALAVALCHLQTAQVQERWMTALVGSSAVRKPRSRNRRPVPGVLSTR